MAYYYSSQSGLYLQNQSGSNLVNLITKGFNVDFLPLTLDKINNRVGINNTTPQHTLDIEGSLKANALTFGNTINSLELDAFNNLYTNISASNKYIIGTNNFDKKFVADGSNSFVGINEEFPAYQLHVNGAIKSTSVLTSSINLNGKLNISHFFDNITFNSSANTIEITANYDMTVKIPSNKKNYISYSGGENILELDATTNSIGIN
jgi:hypothetical protein